MATLRHLPQSCTIEKKDFVLYVDNRTRELELLITETYNRKGYIAEIYKVDNRGRRCCILVLEGTDKSGWAHFADLLNDKKEASTKVKLTTRMVDKRKKIICFSSDTDSDSQRSYAIVVIRGSSSDEEIHHISTNANTREKKKKGEQTDETAFDWNKTIVLITRYFHDDLKRIIEKLKEQLDQPINYKPFHAYKALIFFEDKEQAKLICKNRG
ncbi:hypothetical protein E5676_scaffold456G00160 [Cucumis melo var. makuwa]|uniref:Uncharacterized protein n=1 Tax=Cucumis melo var. makuwa TaxID=1194695 RepID=A0A5D3D436_CUCMM|nr:hypothetical protein E5676_scaffold456G00160 [Cucumis melo var. makuwa]